MLFHQAQSFSREFKLLFDEDHTVEIEIYICFATCICYSSVSICTHRKPRLAAVSEINVLVHRFSTALAQRRFPEISLLHSLTARR